MTLTDPILKSLTEKQTALFNRDAPEVERIAVYMNIQDRQKEIKGGKK